MPISNGDQLLDLVFIMGVHVYDDVLGQGVVGRGLPCDPSVDDPDVIDVHLVVILEMNFSVAKPDCDPGSNNV